MKNAIPVRRAIILLGALLAVSFLGSCNAKFPNSGSPLDHFSLSVSPGEVTGGTTATVMVDDMAGGAVADKVLTLTSSDPSVAAVPATVTVKSGQTSGSFAATTFAVTTTTDIIINATSSDPKDPAILPVHLKVDPPKIVSLTLSQSAVVGGTPVTGTATLNGPAPVGGVKVTLNSNSAAVSVPSFTIVPEGMKTATFTATTIPVTAHDIASILAVAGTGSDLTSVLVTPPPATLDNVTPASGFAGDILSVTFGGTNLYEAMLNVPSSSGITIDQTSVSSDGKTITARITISQDAAPGIVNISATTFAGTTGNVTFTVRSLVSEFHDNYVFIGEGFDSSGNPLAVAGSIVPDGAGHFTGEVDVNDNGSSTTETVSGSYTVSPTPTLDPTLNQFIRAVLTFTSIGAGPLQNAVVEIGFQKITSLVSGSWYEEDGNQNSLTGSSYLQDSTAYSAMPMGPFVFMSNSFVGPHTGMVGRFGVTPSTGLFSSAFVDSATTGLGQTAINAPFTGGLTRTDSYGRGTLTMAGQRYSYYAANAKTLYILQTDPISPTNSKLFFGGAYSQQGPFVDPTSAAYPKYTGVLSMHGITASGGQSDAVGVVDFKPFGQVNVRSFDSNVAGAVFSQQTTVGSGTTFDPITSRYYVAYNPTPGWMSASVYYTVNDYWGVVLDITMGGEAKIGTFATQGAFQPTANAFTFRGFGSGTPGGPAKVGAAGFLSLPTGSTTGNLYYDRVAPGMPASTGLPGTMTFGPVDAMTGRSSVVLPGPLFDPSASTFNSTCYPVDANNIYCISATPGRSFALGFQNKF